MKDLPPKYRTRRYQDGDMDAINALYKTVTGLSRSQEEFEWQWLRAPAGVGEMWLIDALQANGSYEIIGHHGLMPLYFSLGDKTVLAGKTENTMVHPAYRSKILYPRFERTFLKEYSGRFDLLFSTIGPLAALRPRKALGYSGKQHWKRYEVSLGKGSLLAAIAALGRESQNRKASSKMRIASAVASLLTSIAGVVGGGPRRNMPSDLIALSNEQASIHPFFESFWAKAALYYPATPRRNREDLNWRYWQNPHGTKTTLVTKEGASVQGYAILTTSDKHRYVLSDIVVMPYSESAFLEMFGAVCQWCAVDGAYCLSFKTTNDAGAPGHYLDASDFYMLNDHWPLSTIIKTPEYPMLRKVCEPDDQSALDVDNWYVTPIVFQGRS